MNIIKVKSIGTCKLQLYIYNMHIACIVFWNVKKCIPIIKEWI